MNCRDFDLYGSAYIDNMLSKEEKLEFENHINKCECCNIRFQNLKMIVESINEIEDIELPIDFSSELKIKLQNEKNSKNRMMLFNKKKLLSGIVAGLLIFIASLSLINNSLINKNRDMYYSEIEDSHINEKSSNFKIASEEAKQELNNTEEETAIKPKIMAMDNIDKKQDEISDENAQNQITKKRFNIIINSFTKVSIILGIGILIYKVWKK